MVKEIKGRPAFVHSGGSKQFNRLNLKLSLLGVLVGIFLLPNLAYLSDITPEEIIELTNQQRQLAGLNELTASQLLSQAAENKSRAILNSQVFNHTINNKKFSAWIRDAGYNYSYAGENLAIDFATSESVIDAWNKSFLHKKNLLSPFYQEIGAAALSGKFKGQDTTVVVQIFGAPAVASARPLAPGEESVGLNSNINFSEINSVGSQIFRAENLLTHSVIKQELPAEMKNKFILPPQNNYANQVNPVREFTESTIGSNNRQFKLFAFSNGVNKFFIQPKINFALNNFLLIFISLTLIYWLIYLHYYYLSKINKTI